ncbi:MAG TPA: YjbH domain-containing protein [Rhabdochlamydiaceae bacterium]|nr:YjbH domain-containing protein [Rhabdochlamydiaceae bacterium]
MKIFLRILVLNFALFSSIFAAPCRTLFDDLELVEQINQKINDRLPFFYNYSFLGGYFNMPSARMAPEGQFAIGASSVPPYTIIGANFMVFDRIELSANYRIFRGSLDPIFGHTGFGDEADRIGNVKFGIVAESDNLPSCPIISYGLDDFIGTKRFSSQYVVVTMPWCDYDFELSLGYGKGRLKGLFGGAAWTPFRRSHIPVLKNISVLAEYDAIDYEKHISEHAKGRSVNFRVNAGLSYVLGDALQLSISSVRGKKLAGSASLRYPLGTTKGLFTKVDDPLPYCSPVDTEQLGLIRPENQFAEDLAFAFGDQGLDLYSVYLRDGSLWIKVVNNRYRTESNVRERIQDLLAALIPCNIDKVSVVVESQGLPSHEYLFRTENLDRFRVRNIGAKELELLSPMRDATHFPDCYDAALLFEREREIWTFTVLPRMLNFFGSSTGKYKYSLGLVTAFEGYLYKEIYYRMQAAYSAVSSMHGLKARDFLNPSKILQVRSDSVKYYQGNNLFLEQAYFQRAWNMSKGWFSRFSAGYFEPAYAGVAGEFLYYPVNSCFAVGVEGACVFKRRYHGFGFFDRVPEFQEGHEVKKHYIGQQYFLDLYYLFKPLQLDFKVKIGQFLARDKGVRIEVMRYFPSGLRFSLWVTLTNGHDHINGRTYFDKGFSFCIPFDLFLKQSSRQFVTYSMSAWLRDVGAIAETGNRLYDLLYEERFD